jgi:hypothetical protein
MIVGPLREQAEKEFGLTETSLDRFSFMRAGF